MIDVTGIRDRYAAVSPHLDERGRRLFAAGEACSAGYGGIAAVVQATGIAASTIGRGLKELARGSDLPMARVRRPGGGRKRLTATSTTLLADLMALVSPGERGDPMSPLRWTCKSLRRLTTELQARGHQISRTVVGELLKQQKFSLQANRKTREGDDHPDRDAQFAHINARVTQALAEGQPVIHDTAAFAVQTTPQHPRACCGSTTCKPHPTSSSAWCSLPRSCGASWGCVGPGTPRTTSASC